ncbi:MAG TPA: universal stress protein [Oculatellaceae cyanobacterium]
MPESSETGTYEQAAPEWSNARASKSKKASVREILLILDLASLEASGPERTLEGLHRLIPTEGSRLHIVHLMKPGELTPTSMVERVQAELWRYGWHLAENRLLTLTHETVTSLVSEVRQANYDLVVLGVPDLPVGKSSELSQFVHHLVSHVPVSVLLWRKPLSEQPHALKIFFGVDGSESSMTAVNKAVELLRLKYANLRLITVLSPLFQDNAVTAPFVNPDVLEQALEANARIIFEMASGLLEAQGVPVPSRQKLIGSPATELGYYAEMEAPDLIVVGSHNRKGLMAWLMGSVSSQLLQWDKHNLLIVR